MRFLDHLVGPQRSDRPSPVNVGELITVRDFGAFGHPTNATVDETASINRAIEAAFAANAGELIFEAKEYAISSTIFVGNGTTTAFSTKNALSLVGCGAPFVRLKDGSAPIVQQCGTRFKWIGSAGGTMVEIAGPCWGNAIRQIALNCNDLAANGLNVVSANRGRFPKVTISDFTQNGLILTTRAIESIGGITEGIATTMNYFEGLEIDGNDANSGVNNIVLDGYLGSASNGIDTTRNFFRSTYMIVTLAGGTGIRMVFSDQNVFDGLVMSAFGTPDGNAAALRFVGCRTTPGNFHFPQNNKIINNVDLGGEASLLPVVNEGAPMHGNVVREQLQTNEF